MSNVLASYEIGTLLLAMKAKALEMICKWLANLFRHSMLQQSAQKCIKRKFVYRCLWFFLLNSENALYCTNFYNFTSTCHPTDTDICCFLLFTESLWISFQGCEKKDQKQGLLWPAVHIATVVFQKHCLMWTAFHLQVVGVSTYHTVHVIVPKAHGLFINKCFC